MRKRNLDEYRKNVANQNISKLLDETLAEKAEHAKRMQALKALKKLGPAFPHIKDASAWVRELRQENEERADRLAI